MSQEKKINEKNVFPRFPPTDIATNCPQTTRKTRDQPEKKGDSKMCHLFCGTICHP